MNRNVTTAIISACSAIVGGIAGYFVSNYHHMKNTPESTIARLEMARETLKVAREGAVKARDDCRKEIEELKRTKKEYQDEMRPEIEKSIRSELESYISEADETYRLAKEKNEMADVKLKLLKEMQKNSANSNGGFFKVSFN